MKKNLILVIGISLLAASVLIGCFVSDANDDNPANTVSPAGTLTGNCVLKLHVEDRQLHTDPFATDWYTPAYVILTNSDGTPIVNAAVTIDVADDTKGLVGFSQEFPPSGGTVSAPFTVVTGTNGGASFYIMATTSALCTKASLNLVATAPYAIAYGGVGLAYDAVACIPTPIPTPAP